MNVTTSFGNLKKKSSLLALITSGFPDVIVSTHVHSFHERRGATFRVSQARSHVPGEWLLSDESTRARTLPFALQIRGSPESNQDFVSARSQGIAVKQRHYCENLQGGYAQEAASHEHAAADEKPSTKKNSRSTIHP